MEKEKFLTPPGLELRARGRPTRSQVLYGLSYPGSQDYALFHWFLLLKVKLLQNENY
jgi:hypothetical protein